MIKGFLRAQALSIDAGLLLLRLVSGSLMLTHGWPKLSGYTEKLQTFADPYGFGSSVSLTLAVFGEVFCSLFVIAGLFTRLALVPLIITMLTAAFIVHAADPLNKKELALVYLVIFVALLFTGPGRFSLDAQRKKITL